MIRMPMGIHHQNLFVTTQRADRFLQIGKPQACINQKRLFASVDHIHHCLSNFIQRPQIFSEGSNLQFLHFCSHLRAMARIQNQGEWKPFSFPLPSPSLYPYIPVSLPAAIHPLCPICIS